VNYGGVTAGGLGSRTAARNERRDESKALPKQTHPDRKCGVGIQRKGTMNYWKDVVSESLEANGVDFTTEQLDAIASDMKSAHGMYGEASGAMCIPNPIELENTRLKKLVKNMEDETKCPRCGKVMYVKWLATRNAQRCPGCFLEVTL